MWRTIAAKHAREWTSGCCRRQRRPADHGDGCDPESQVRTRLRAGGSRIRTFGPAVNGGADGGARGLASPIAKIIGPLRTHSHIPLSRKTPFPGGGELPKQYYDAMDPFVVLAAAGQVTNSSWAPACCWFSSATRSRPPSWSPRSKGPRRRRPLRREGAGRADCQRASGRQCRPDPRRDASQLFRCRRCGMC
jgi:hypothetical protein